MRIQLEELKHQIDALNAIFGDFNGLDNKPSLTPFSNPLVKNAYNENSFFDVKMETGTGKTYVYTRLIYELHRQFGLFKFVIVVPSPAIKIGTKNFIESEYARRHFSQFYENVTVELSVVNAGDFKSKSGRRNFPAQLSNFIEGSKHNTHIIHILLVNSDMLRSSSMTRDDYDQTLIGGVTSPIEAIKDTNPIIIIDEPHQFPRDKKNYEAIMSLNPQLIFRFGATFPEIKVGKGKNSTLKKDYYKGKPIYDLNAVESFNHGLVKGIDIYYPNLSEEQIKNTYTIDNVSPKELTLKKGNQKWSLSIGEPLSNIDEDFEGDIEYLGSKELSNNLLVEPGMKLIPGTFKTTYQELIIQDAIIKHFEIEQANFLRSNQRDINKPRIKTLSLFFIDNIRSYREKDGWLKLVFEKHLLVKLKQLIKEYELKFLPREIEYLDFLRSTLRELCNENQSVHAGYFGEDRESSDESIQLEVEDILRNKEKLLSFKDDKGNWITRRFLFSKWTLREGWDNPNVFVITKLRTSGSETSKIQEVGRGLRLPVDEKGNRIQVSEWDSRLAFLIGYDEKDFAKKLVGEINSDIKIKLDFSKLTEDMITTVVEKRKNIDSDFSKEKLFESLDKLKIINRMNEFINIVNIDGVEKNGYEWFLELYPEINETQLHHGKVRDRNDINKYKYVKLNQANWAKVKDLWERFSKGYMIEFNRIPNSIDTVTYEVLSNVQLFVKDSYQKVHETFQNKDNRVEYQIQEESYSKNSYKEGIPYGQFLIQLHDKLNIPVKTLHKYLFIVFKNELNFDSKYLSLTSLNNLTKEFKSRFDNTFSQIYKYKVLDFSASTSIFDSSTNTFIDEINSNLIGTNFVENTIKDDRYLYDKPPLFFDSYNPEKLLLDYKYDSQITAFGKLPKNSIQVPKYTGGTTTPDMIFVIEKNNNIFLYLLVETKAENMRVNDQQIIDIQKEFFKLMENFNIRYTEAYKPEDVHNKIREIMGESNE